MFFHNVSHQDSHNTGLENLKYSWIGIARNRHNAHLPRLIMGWTATSQQHGVNK